MKKTGLLIVVVLLLSTSLAAAQTPPPRVLLETSLGVITLELDPAAAPKTVNNFLDYVRAGSYGGTIFHRVINGFMIQGGGLTVDMQPKPTRPPIPNEADNGLKNRRGTIAMARTSDPHSATSQFFINVEDNAFLDHKAKTPKGWGYCVFGRVVEGMAVVEAIEKGMTTTKGPFRDVPVTAVIIEKARILKD